jgi:hypothetical protein
VVSIGDVALFEPGFQITSRRELIHFHIMDFAISSVHDLLTILAKGERGVKEKMKIS